MLSARNHLLCWAASVSVALTFSITAYGYIIFPLAMFLQYACEHCPFLTDFVTSHIPDLGGTTKVFDHQTQPGEQEKDQGQNQNQDKGQKKEPHVMLSSRKFWLMTFFTRVLALGALAKFLCMQGPESLHNEKSVMIFHTLLAFRIISRETRLWTVVS